MTSNPDSWRASSLVEEIRQLGDARRWYLTHPTHFALGDPEERYPAILGPDILHYAAKRSVASFFGKQEAYLRDFCDVRVSRFIARTGRSCGKTFLSALAQATMAWCLPMFTCTVSAGSKEQAARNYRYWLSFARSPDMFAARGGPLLATPKATFAPFRNGGWLKVLAASEKSVQGEHPMMTVLDEACATAEDIMELLEGQISGSPPPYGADAALYRVMSTGTKLRHKFVEKWEAREDLGYAWKTWGQKECPWITEEEIAQQVAEHSQNWVNIHIHGKFGSATGTVFDERHVLAAVVPRLGLDAVGEKDELWEAVEEEDPRLTVRHALGVDWGFEHPTVLTVSASVDVDPGTRAARFPDIPRWPRVYTRHIESHRHTDLTFRWERIAKVAGLYRASAFLDSEAASENARATAMLRQIGLRGEIVSFGKWKLSMIDAATALLEKRGAVIPQMGGAGTETLEGQALIDQILRYSWDESGGRERPRKGDDDYVDSWILSVWGLGRAPVSRVRSIRR